MRREPLPIGATIGIMGGGQLARMLAMSAAQLGYHTHIYNPESGSPAEEVALYTTVASYGDENALRAFADAVDVVTVEFENIPTTAAEFLAAQVPFYPSPALFAMAQYRLSEKLFVQSCGVAVAPYHAAQTEALFCEAVATIDVPCIAKHTREGYDGKGQMRVDTVEQCATVWRELGGKELVVEAFVPFMCEASILVARSSDGQMVTFPIARNVHTGGILKQSIVPANLAASTEARMQEIARTIAEAGDLIGLLAIECFILENGEVVVNELATRPHNSGHWTMDGCSISQFEMLVRVCAGLPLPTPHMVSPTIMVNLIGEEAQDVTAWLANPNARLHLYGKDECRAGRKMGHVNLVQYA
jgi:5-(carboxyamino)imidazole ribonucleotide synthase